MEILNGETKSWRGGWAVVFAYGAVTLEQSPDDGTTWFPVNDNFGNPVNGLVDDSTLVPFASPVLIRCTAGTKALLVRGHAHVKGPGH